MKVYVIKKFDHDSCVLYGMYATKEIAKKYLKKLYNKEYYFYRDEEEDNDAFRSSLQWENDERFIFRWRLVGSVNTVWEIQEEEVIEE